MLPPETKDDWLSELCTCRENWRIVATLETRKAAQDEAEAWRQYCRDVHWPAFEFESAGPDVFGRFVGTTFRKTRKTKADRPKRQHITERIFRHLEKHGPCTAYEMARAINVNKNTIIGRIYKSMRPVIAHSADRVAESGNKIAVYSIVPGAVYEPRLYIPEFRKRVYQGAMV